ncbi:MAG TPA: DNA mismatch repair protein [Polyangiaceae bacterium]|nr:DNA mismatch repair protein [Polyangiaceae bacterium]
MSEPRAALDLLFPTPALRIDLEQTSLGLDLAFAGGVAGGLFSDALDRAPVGPTAWKAASFAADLFVPAFVASCFTIGDGQLVSQKHLVKLVTSPPADPAVVLHRRAVVDELVTHPSRREALRALYTDLLRLRSMLEGATGAGKWDANRRQLDILTLVKKLFDRLAELPAEGASSSALARLSDYGERVLAGEPYRSLADLLRYDESMATLSLKVGIGADGRIRGFQLLSVEEDRQNPFVSSAWRRWLAKVELFVRGYRFGDGEVMARLIDAVFDGLRDELAPLVQLVGDLEFYLGALGLRDAAAARGLSMCLPKLAEPGEPRVLEGLWNPLLLASGVAPVPCDLRLDRHDACVLVTGPNSGGKTRLLQAVGLSQVLAQVGLFVPARAGCVMLGSSLVVSLIQETRVDQAEGRLGMELLRIRELFESLPPGAMVILDELCSGTNPSEGEEIFELVIRMLTRLRPQTFITTHFLAFATRLEAAGEIDELRFLQVELDPNHLPTYQFTPGVAQTSLAGKAAARLGVTGEQLLALIERNLAAAEPGREGQGRA